VQNNNKTIRRVVLDIDSLFVCVCFYQSGKASPLHRNILRIYLLYLFRNSVFGDSVPVDRYGQEKEREREKKKKIAGNSSIK
jgi:hypothetical protein